MLSSFGKAIAVAAPHFALRHHQRHHKTVTQITNDFNMKKVENKIFYTRDK